MNYSKSIQHIHNHSNKSHRLNPLKVIETNRLIFNQLCISGLKKRFGNFNCNIVPSGRYSIQTNKYEEGIIKVVIQHPGGDLLMSYLTRSKLYTLVTKHLLSCDSDFLSDTIQLQEVVASILISNSYRLHSSEAYLEEADVEEYLNSSIQTYWMII